MSSQKRPKKQNLRKLAAYSPKPRAGHILGYVAQNVILRVHPQPPTFRGFYPSELPKRTPRPRTGAYSALASFS